MKVCHQKNNYIFLFGIANRVAITREVFIRTKSGLTASFVKFELINFIRFEGLVYHTQKFLSICGTRSQAIFQGDGDALNRYTLSDGRIFVARNSVG